MWFISLALKNAKKKKKVKKKLWNKTAAPQYCTFEPQVFISVIRRSTNWATIRGTKFSSFSFASSYFWHIWEQLRRRCCHLATVTRKSGQIIQFAIYPWEIYYSKSRRLLRHWAVRYMALKWFNGSHVICSRLPIGLIFGERLLIGSKL